MTMTTAGLAKAFFEDGEAINDTGGRLGVSAVNAARADPSAHELRAAMQALGGVSRTARPDLLAGQQVTSDALTAAARAMRKAARPWVCPTCSDEDAVPAGHVCPRWDEAKGVYLFGEAFAGEHHHPRGDARSCLGCAPCACDVRGFAAEVEGAPRGNPWCSACGRRVDVVVGVDLAYAPQAEAQASDRWCAYCWQPTKSEVGICGSAECTAAAVEHHRETEYALAEPPFRAWTPADVLAKLRASGNGITITFGSGAAGVYADAPQRGKRHETPTCVYFSSELTAIAKHLNAKRFALPYAPNAAPAAPSPAFLADLVGCAELPRVPS